MKVRSELRSPDLALGFALIELVGVLAVMAILAGALAPLLLRDLDKAEQDRELKALEAIAAGLRQYYLNENDPATYGQLPTQAAWTTALAGTYVAGSAADLQTNDRDVARFYVFDYPNFSVSPQITLASHTAAGGTAIPVGPPGFASTCIGSALEDTDPCTPPPGGAGFAADVVDADMRVLNLNLSAQRQQIIDHVREGFLSPIAALFGNLSPDVCRGIVDTVLPGNYPVNDAINLPAAITGAAVTQTDPWGNLIRISKSDTAITVWSGGPGGLAASTPPANPLFVTQSCASGQDVTLDLERVRDAVLGFAQTQITYPRLPNAAEYAGLAVDKSDPWGTAIAYALDGSNGFTLTSNGPNGVAGGGDDVTLSPPMDGTALIGFFARLGQTYPAPPLGPSSPCAGYTATLSGPTCNTFIGYLRNAATCNSAAVNHRDLGCS